MTTHTCRNEARELTDADLDLVSGGSLKDVADAVSNALAPVAVSGWEWAGYRIPTNSGPIHSS